jgi:hypothetical protein
VRDKLAAGTTASARPCARRERQAGRPTSETAHQILAINNISAHTTASTKAKACPTETSQAAAVQPPRRLPPKRDGPTTNAQRFQAAGSELALEHPNRVPNLHAFSSPRRSMSGRRRTSRFAQRASDANQTDAAIGTTTERALHQQAVRKSEPHARSTSPPSNPSSLSAQRTGVQLRAPEEASDRREQATDEPVCCNALLGGGAIERLCSCELYVTGTRRSRRRRSTTSTGTPTENSIRVVEP